MSRSTARWIALVSLFWLVALGCRTSDLVAEANPATTITRTVTRTVVRPTFTPAPPTLPPTDLPPQLPDQPLPTAPLIVPTRLPTSNVPVAPRPTVIVRTATPAPPPPTPDPYAGYYFKPVNRGCAASGNTRIEGTVTDNGRPKDGVKVRLSDMATGGPLINDFITGTDPSDYNHKCPECAGKYRLGIAEGQRIDGNWWVYVLDNAGNPLSPGVYIKTFDVPGCNSATIDFVH